MAQVEFKHFHFCCGLGAAARGFNQSRPRVGNQSARWRCLGGVDVDRAAIADFKRLTGVSGTVLDLFTLDQYLAFWGHMPPAGWREALPVDIRRAAGNESPDVVFISSPCKGASGLLSEELAATPKYQALNELTLRCVWLMLEAWKDNPPALIVFENVPRLAKRGRALLDQIGQLLRHYGYAVAETRHNCGEIGRLAQSRERFLLVARHVEKVPPMLYEPEKHRLQPVGAVLGRLPLPDDEGAGPMHRVPNLQLQTWLRLALIQPGKDWRFLNGLRVENGVLQDFVMVPDARNSYLGVRKWDEPTGVVSGRAGPTNGAYSVAVPPTAGKFGKYCVTPYDGASGTVIAGSTTGQGAFAVADVRCGLNHTRGESAAFASGGHYGVLRMIDVSGAVTGSARHDSGKWSIADTRWPDLMKQHMAILIISPWKTWNRPFTTLELAALQDLIEPGETFALDGKSDSAWRERIGNAVPCGAARAIADVMGVTLLLALGGETFILSAMPVWVQPIAAALAVAHNNHL